MGELLAAGLAGGAFVGLLGAAEAAARRWELDRELPRKLVHISSGLLAACLPAFMSFATVAALALVFAPLMVVSRRVGLFPALHGVERWTIGEIWFPLGVALTALLFPHQPAYAYGVLVMGISDAMASLAGRRWGRRRYCLLGAAKTFLGSGVFLLTTLALGTGALAAAGWQAWTAPAAAAMAAACTVAEGLLGGGSDNLVLPVVAAGLFTLAT